MTECRATGTGLKGRQALEEFHVTFGTRAWKARLINVRVTVSPIRGGEIERGRVFAHDSVWYTARRKNGQRSASDQIAKGKIK